MGLPIHGRCRLASDSSTPVHTTSYRQHALDQSIQLVDRPERPLEAGVEMYRAVGRATLLGDTVSYHRKAQYGIACPTWRMPISIRIPYSLTRYDGKERSIEVAPVDRPCVITGKSPEITSAVWRAIITEEGVQLLATPDDLLVLKHDEPNIHHYRANTMRPAAVPTRQQYRRTAHQGDRVKANITRQLHWRIRTTRTTGWSARSLLCNLATALCSVASRSHVAHMPSLFL